MEGDVVPIETLPFESMRKAVLVALVTADVVDMRKRGVVVPAMADSDN